MLILCVLLMHNHFKRCVNIFRNVGLTQFWGCVISMQQKQENVRQIGLLQNDTSVCVSKSVLFKHNENVCKCAFIML